MNISRRFFIGGGAAFGAFSGCRFLCAPAGFKAGETPRLRFGVVSDIHILRVGANEKMEGGANNLTFKHTLEWFREQGVDAVAIAGDMADKGMGENLMAVGQAWYAVFPGDKYPDGRPVTKFFITGNHDWDGFNYGGHAEKLYSDLREREKHILRKNIVGWWDKAFHEPYTPFSVKQVNGYTFLGAHWDTGGHGAETGKKVDPFARIEEYMAKNGKSFDPNLPFFYVQHPHPKDTCYGPWAWGHDKGKVTQALSAYPNAVAFSGHSHYSLTDERSIWQGAFTSVGTSSLRYTGHPYDEFANVGYENSGAGSRKAWKIDAAKSMKRYATSDCRQGMLWSVYDDCIVVKRREFLSNLDIGEDWVLPLPVAEAKPFAFAAHAQKMHAPEFPQGAALTVTPMKSINRGGKSLDGKECVPSVKKPSFRVVTPPVAPDPNGRLFRLEFVAETPDGKKRVKHVLAVGFNHSEKSEKAASRQWCYFFKDELGAGDVRFTVTPINCFGARGKPLVATVPVA